MVSRRRTQGGEFKKVLLSFENGDLDRLDGFIELYNAEHPGEMINRSAMLSRLLNAQLKQEGFGGSRASRYISRAREKRKQREQQAAARRTART